MRNNRKCILLSIVLLCFLTQSCRKQLEVDIPPYKTPSESVYKNQASAAGVLSGIYLNLSVGNLWRVSYVTGLSSDELTLDNSVSNTELIAYYKNALTGINIQGGSVNDFWSTLYPNVYFANAAIEGLTASTTLSETGKNELIGEAKFIRAFCYFYLTNLYGDVPLALTTDYKVNSLLAKSPASEVWKQIITDLLDAQRTLSDNFTDASAVNVSTERVRPNKWTATALLARAYLYTGAYADAEVQSSSIINNTALFSLSALDNAFIKNNPEAIWQLQPVEVDVNTYDARFFVIPASGPSDAFPVYISDTLSHSFEKGDLRQSQWIGTVTVEGKNYHSPYKYKVNEAGQPVTEYNTLFRLAEQYLIRAEARVNQVGKLADGIADLNIIRARARAAATVAVPNPLPSIPASLSKEDALNAVLYERQVELFSEWGHRWLDLKRTGKVDKLMPVITARKGGTWNTNWQLYPIPNTELQKTPNVKQNTGYK